MQKRWLPWACSPRRSATFAENLKLKGTGLCLRALDMGSFLPFEFSLDDNGRFAEEDVAGLLRMKDLLLQSSDAQILRHAARFLGQAPAEP